MFEEYAMLRLGINDLEELSGRGPRRAGRRRSEPRWIPATARLRRTIRRTK